METIKASPMIFERVPPFSTKHLREVPSEGLGRES